MRPVAATDFSQFAQLRADARNDSPDALRNTAKQFEALMLQQMLKSMRAASLGDDVMGGEQTQFYQDMFDSQISQHLAAGRGLGVADMLVRQLQQREAGVVRGEAQQPVSAALASASKPAVSAARGERPTQNPQSTPHAAFGRTGTDSMSVPLEPNARTPHDPAAFVRSILPHAERAAAELGIPAKVLVAQAALETG